MIDRVKNLIEVDWTKLESIQPEDAKIQNNIEALKSSLKTHGFSLPFAIWTNNGKHYTVDGHTRIKALKELKTDGVNVPEKLKAFEIDAKDRKEAIKILVEVFNQKHNPFDSGVLVKWLDVEEVEIENIEAIHVNEAISDKTEVEEDDFEIPNEDEIETNIKLGDLIEIGKHRLLCGDSTDAKQVEYLMNGSKVDLVFTDPDYSMNDDDLFACYENTKNVELAFWVCADKQAVKLAVNDFDNFTHFFIHNYKVPTMISSTQPMTKHNMICKFGNRKMNNLKDGFSTIVDVATERTLESHKKTRMSKRVELPFLFISHYTQENDVVQDIFMHSGSTMVACEQLNRICYGMELEPKYCQVIIDRMRNSFPNLEVKINGKVYNE